jgi:large subunit ribosomal protein L25
MADVITLAASARTQSGKGPARAARRDGLVPAIIYGNDLEPVSISVERKALERQIHVPGFFIRLVDVALDGESHRVLPREVQFHPVSDVPLHVDFLRFSADRKITVAVPVQFLNEEDSPGLKRGGVLNIVRHEVEVLCTADSIPQIFEIDLTGLDIGDAIHGSMVTLPEGVTFTITDRDFTIATVAAPTVVTEDEKAEEGEEIEGEEGAVAEVEEGEAAEDSETKDEG